MEGRSVRELRSQIYYWKCDRPATLYGVARSKDSSSDVLLPQLLRFLKARFQV